MKTIVVTFGAGLARPQHVDEHCSHEKKIASSIGRASRVRVLAAAILSRACGGATIILSGGHTTSGFPAEAEAMEAYLRTQSWVPCHSTEILTETRSIDTADNVRKTVEIIRQLPFQPDQIILVTHRRQLYRATQYFRGYGLDVVPVSVTQAFGLSPGIGRVFRDRDPTERWRLRSILLWFLLWFDPQGSIVTWWVRHSRDR